MKEPFGGKRRGSQDAKLSSRGARKTPLHRSDSSVHATERPLSQLPSPSPRSERRRPRSISGVDSRMTHASQSPKSAQTFQPCMMDQLFTDASERGRALQYIHLAKKNRYAVFAFQNLSVMSIPFANTQAIQLSTITPLIILKAKRQALVTWMLDQYITLPDPANTPPRGRKFMKTKASKLPPRQILKKIVATLLTSQEASAYQTLSIKHLKGAARILIPEEYHTLYGSALKKLAALCTSIETIASQVKQRQAELQKIKRLPYADLEPLAASCDPTLIPAGFVEVNTLFSILSKATLQAHAASGPPSPDGTSCFTVSNCLPLFHSPSFRQTVYQQIRERWLHNEATFGPSSASCTIIGMTSTEPSSQLHMLLINEAKIPMLLSLMDRSTLPGALLDIHAGLTHWCAYERFKARVSTADKRALYKFSCRLCGIAKDHYTTEQSTVYNNLLALHAVHTLPCTGEEITLLARLGFKPAAQALPHFTSKDFHAKYLMIPDCRALLKLDEVAFMTPSTQAQLSFFAQLVTRTSTHELKAK